MTVRHVVVIGAARSGTKMLRDTLATAAGAGVIPYDIGYVWRRGNEGAPDDVIPPGEIDARTRRFIRTFVDRYAHGDPATVIEKTVGNAMRVPAVDAVLPDAVYIHLIRDGVDAIESARRQWTAKADMRYLLAKAKHFPWRLVPTYGLKYVRSQLRRRSSADERVATWGPRYPGIDADLASSDLLVVCARQWKCAVQMATADLSRLGVPVIDVRYEELIARPAAHLGAVIEQAGLMPNGDLDSAAAVIGVDRRGSGRRSLTPPELAVLDGEVGALLSDLGYGRPVPPNTPGRT